MAMAFQEDWQDITNLYGTITQKAKKEARKNAFDFLGFRICQEVSFISYIQLRAIVVQDKDVQNFIQDIILLCNGVRLVQNYSRLREAFVDVIPYTDGCHKEGVGLKHAIDILIILQDVLIKVILKTEILVQENITLGNIAKDVLKA